MWLGGPSQVCIRVGLRQVPQGTLPVFDPSVLLLQVKHKIIFTLIAVGLGEGVILPKVRALLPWKDRRTESERAWKERASTQCADMAAKSQQPKGWAGESSFNIIQTLVASGIISCRHGVPEGVDCSIIIVFGG